MNRQSTPPVPPVVAALRVAVHRPNCPLTVMARAAEVAHQPVPAPYPERSFR